MGPVTGGKTPAERRLVADLKHQQSVSTLLQLTSRAAQAARNSLTRRGTLNIGLQATSWGNVPLYPSQAHESELQKVCRELQRLIKTILSK